MKALLLCGFSLLLVGCGDAGTAADKTAAASVTANQASASEIAPPDFSHESGLGMVRAAHSKALLIGMQADDALGVFTGPPGAYSRSDLPPAIPSGVYDAQGWQTKDEGFGMILYKGRVGLALYEQDRTSQD